MALKGNKTKGQRALETETGVKQLEAATRISQMLIQRIGQSVTSMSRTIEELTARQRELQYRVLAMQELSNVDVDTLTHRAEELQIKDFHEASDKEDAAIGAIDSEFVAEDSIVLLTTKVASGGGILRTRIKVSEINFPEFKKDILNKRVGDTLDTNLDGIVHAVTILGIKQIPVKADDVQYAATTITQ